MLFHFQKLSIIWKYNLPSDWKTKLLMATKGMFLVIFRVVCTLSIMLSEEKYTVVHVAYVCNPQPCPSLRISSMLSSDTPRAHR